MVFAEDPKTRALTSILVQENVQEKKSNRVSGV